MKKQKIVLFKTIKMNIYQATVFWTIVAIFILCITLPAVLVRPPPDTGSSTPHQFLTGTPAWIIPITSQCILNISTDYSSIRSLSNTIFNNVNVPNNKHLSNLIWGFSQLVMEDLFQFNLNTAVPTLDIFLNSSLGYMNVTQVMTRCGTNLTQNPWGCCEISNSASTVLDANWLYGDYAISQSLRNFVRGQMSLSTGGNLPFVSGNSGPFKAGTSNVNENPLLASLVTLFVLEHNYWANLLFSLHPDWTDNQLFYKARSYVLVEYQSIILKEWLPAIFPIIPKNVPISSLYLTTSQVSLELALTAGAFFRSMTSLPLFVNDTSSHVITRGITSILEEAWITGAQSMDVHVVETLCNNSETKIDYISRQLAWSQQVGLASYSNIANSFSIPQIFRTTTSPAINTALSGIFGEPNLSGSSLGASVLYMLSDQVQRSIANDPYFYTSPLIPPDIGNSFYVPLQRVSLQDIMIRNLAVTPGLGAFYGKIAV
jgi:hypothetical protein